MMKKLKSKVFLFLILSLLLIPESLLAYDGDDLVPSNLEMIFAHQKSDSGDNSGMSLYYYAKKDNLHYILAKIFSKDKKLRRLRGSILSKEGEMMEFIEKDFEENYLIHNLYEQKKIYSFLQKSDEVKQFHQSDPAKLVTVEQLEFFLRKKLFVEKITDEFTLELYLPALKFNPYLSVTKITMKVELSDPFEKVYFGKLHQVVQAKMYPDSAFYRLLIPDDKSHYYLTFQVEAPYLLLESIGQGQKYFIEKLDEIKNQQEFDDLLLQVFAFRNPNIKNSNTK